MIVGCQQLAIHNTLQIAVYVFFYLIEQHSQFLLHTLQVLYDDDDETKLNISRCMVC